MSNRFLHLKRCFFVILISISFSQEKFKILGTVKDASNQEPLIGVLIVLFDTNYGTMSDLNGDYILTDIPSGKYSMKISYLGYESILKEINLVSDDLTENFLMEVSILQTDLVNVTARKREDTSASLIVEQKQSSIVQDGIAAEQMSKTGDSNIAEGVKRITGISVVDDKFAVIRGLPERYSDTQLNNAPVSSPEPDKKAVPLDMFPTEIIESIVAVKTATPDLPSTFSSGGVIIKTKPYPDKYIFKLKLGASDDENSSSDGYYYMGSGEGRYDYLGYDKGNRSIKNLLPNFQLEKGSFSNPNSGLMQNIINPNSELYGMIDNPVYGCYDSDEGEYVSNSQNNCFGEDLNWRLANNIHRTYQQYKIYADYFKSISNNGFDINKKKKINPISFSISHGNKIKQSRKFEWGYFINVAFKNDFDYQTYTKAPQISLLGNQLIPQFQRDITESSYKTSSGVNFNIGSTFIKRHTFKYQGNFNHTSKDKFQYGYGLANNYNAPGYFLLDKYVEKNIYSHTISGLHEFKKGIHIIDWSINDGKATRYEPDTRRSDFDTVDDEGTAYRIYDHSGEKVFGYIEYLEGFDNSSTNDLNYSLDLEKSTGLPIKFKTGVRRNKKNRDFGMRRLLMQWAPGLETLIGETAIPDSAYVFTELEDFGSTSSGNEDYIFDYDYNDWSIENINVQDSELDRSQNGWILFDDTPNNKTGAYSAIENVDAAFVMIDLPLGLGKNKFADKFYFSGGFRLEQYEMLISAYNPVTGLISNMIGTTGESGGIQSKKEKDLIPSFNFQFNINDNQKLRLSYSNSINRPLFRELTPIAYQEMLDGATNVGYPYLETTDIKNYDFRYELYPSIGELFTISYFKKYFDNPIEVFKVKTTDLVYKIYNNAESAETEGLEFELRKKFSKFKNEDFGIQFFINTTISKSSVISNPFVRIAVPYESSFIEGGQFTSYDSQFSSQGLVGITVDSDCTNLFNTFSDIIPSEIEADCVPSGVGALYMLEWESESYTYEVFYNEFGNQSSLDRPLQGQSDFIFNLGLDFSFPKDLNISLSYNTFSQRVAAAGAGLGGEEYELPFESLNISASKDFAFGKLNFKIKNLLESSEVFGHYGVVTDEQGNFISGKDSGAFTESYRYNPGKSFSMGFSINI